MALIRSENEQLLKGGALPIHFGACHECGTEADIVMRGYGDGDIVICRFHALQLARKLLEDLCDMVGDRHG